MTAIIDKGPTLGARHMQALLIFLSTVAVYMSRMNIGVALVAMTNAATTNPDFPEFDWDEKETSYILSSLYWGYVLTQLPGGMLSKRFGANVVINVSIFLSAVCSASTPLCVKWGGWKAYCVIRFCQGLSQGAIFPSIYEHLAKWMPKDERCRLSALSQTGVECGTVLALAVSGLIAEGPLGWPGISYISAGMCLLCCLLWTIFGSNNATVSKFITEKEKHYIESSLERAEDFHDSKIPIPWISILQSVPLIVLLIARCAENFGLNILQTQLPAYMNGVLGFHIKSNALFSSLPFLAKWCMSYVYVLLAELILRKNLFSLTALRKIFNSLAYWIPAVGLIGVGFLGVDNKAWAITLMTVLVAFNSGACIGSSLNTIDLAPNHAGVLMGITNTVVNFMPIIAPLIVGVIVSDTTNRSQWQLVFIMAAIVFFFGNLIYVIWGTTKAQPWDAEDFLTPKDTESSCNKDSQNKDDICKSGEVKM